MTHAVGEGNRTGSKFVVFWRCTAVHEDGRAAAVLNPKSLVSYLAGRSALKRLRPTLSGEKSWLGCSTFIQEKTTLRSKWRDTQR